MNKVDRLRLRRHKAYLRLGGNTLFDGPRWVLFAGWDLAYHMALNPRLRRPERKKRRMA